MMSSNSERDGGNVISFDMGGTSTDISLVNKGSYTITTEQQLEWEGYLRFPCIDIHSIGAGGGSIAWVDEANCLHVGPQSAGAVPGPACYDTGGDDATVTDANLVLGYLNPNNYIGGRYKLSRQQASRAIGKLAKKLDLDATECALGIRAIVDSNMVYGIRFVSVERGNDPREYSLIAFGGAGPLHAAELMLQLGMKRAIVPMYPGNVSAVGLLGARPKIDLMRTVYGILDDLDFQELENLYQSLEQEGAKHLELAGIRKNEVETIRSLDMRYTGQTYEIIIDNIPSSLSNKKKGEIEELFHNRHYELYGYFNEHEPIAAVNIRATVLGPERKINIFTEKVTLSNPKPYDERQLVFNENGKPVKFKTAIFKREMLSPGFEYDGPVLIEEDLSTTLIPPGFKLCVLERGTLEIQIKQGV
jgi:N-methylhydantoinase A